MGKISDLDDANFEAMLKSYLNDGRKVRLRKIAGVEYICVRKYDRHHEKEKSLGRLTESRRAIIKKLLQGDNIYISSSEEN